MRLAPLEVLSRKVEDFAALCKPDFIYEDGCAQGMVFAEVDLSSVAGDNEPKTVGLVIENPDPTPHVFTRWSRTQVLSHMGVREKWFRITSGLDEVQELNRRLPTMQNHMVRTMESFDDPGLRLIRGFVSRRYADIPDTEIMRALTGLMPEGSYLKQYSGKTDRALYVYALTPGEPVEIPGTQLKGRPGVVIKNSEVGFTSLWVIPILFISDDRDPHGWIPLVLEKQVALRRVHRGSVDDLASDFKGALGKAAGVWGSLEDKLQGLANIHYPDIDTAVLKMTEALDKSGATRAFAFRCEQHYRANPASIPDGVGVFNSVLHVVGEETNQDDAYVKAAVAGAMLFRLLGLR